MKSALKFYFVLALLAVVCIANAQTYRLEIGYNNPKRFGSGVSSTYFDGVKLGATAEYKLKNNFSLLTGVLYNFVYSDKIQGYPSSAEAKFRTTGHFLDIPARAIYTYPLSKSLKVFGFAGPNLNIGLAQNLKINSTLTYPSTSPLFIQSRSIDLYGGSDADYQLNRLNLQIGVGGGIQWKKYQIKATYDFGLNNLNRTSSGNLYQKGWYISVAYDF
jgi:hypothetical protein